MMRVSPPELARELPGPQASTSDRCAPIRKRWRAVQPPKAPAATTTAFGFTRGAASKFMAGRAVDWRMERREVVLFIRGLQEFRRGRNQAAGCHAPSHDSQNKT